MRVLVSCTVVLLALLHASCAHDTGYGAVTTSWDSAASNQPTSDSAAPPPPSKVPDGTPKKVSVKDYAAEQHSGKECLEKVREHYAKDPHSAEALLSECAHRDDVMDLDGILKGPWTHELKNNENYALLVAQVIAHRGGFVEADTRAARAAGVPLFDAAQITKEGNKGVGRLVVVRGPIVAVKGEKWGTGRSDVANIAETSWVDDNGDESNGQIPARENVEKTGRTVYARLAEKRKFTAEQAYVVVIRYEGPRDSKTKGDEGEELASFIGGAVAFYDANPQLHR